VLTRENKLWRAVLEQAYQDAELWASYGELVPAPAERTKALRYLCADSAHESAGLAIVCDYADVPVDRVVSWARRRYHFAA
jgi:hypothetical protein